MTDKNELPDGTLSKSTAKRVEAPAARGVDTSTNEAWAARAQEKIAAMGSASGGEDDMCPNCVTPWKCNGPHLLPPSAPSADAVRELVLLSRGLAKRTFNRSTAEMYIHFADELESLLGRGGK